MLEVAVRILGPELVFQFFACDQLSGAEEQGFEHLEGLSRQADSDALFTKLRCAQICFEDTETHHSRGLRRIVHGGFPGVVSSLTPNLRDEAKLFLNRNRFWIE